MADRDVRVIYKTREIPNGYQPRIPTAFDPYHDSFDGEPIRRSKSTRERNGNSTIDAASILTTPRSIRSSYAVDNKRGSGGAFADLERLTYRDRSRPRSIKADDSELDYHRNIDLDQNSDRRNARRSQADLEPGQQRSSKGWLEVEYAKDRSRSREYVADKGYNSSRGSIQKESGAYVMDARGEIDIIMPDREQHMVHGRRGSRYSHDTPTSRTRIYYDDEARQRPEPPGDGVVLLRSNIAPSSRYERTRPQLKTEDDIRISQRAYDRDDDWRIVDSMRDTRLNSPDSGHQRRSRAPTQSSDDSFVMVSSTQDSRPTVRSAMRRSDYPPAELRRRRSRSISFRESETVSHEVGDRRHERPGAEADICGPYLKRRPERDLEVDPNDYDDTRVQPRRPSRRSEVGRRDDDRYQEPYGPQQANLPRPRESSRRRRHRDEDADDAASYYSERIDRQYTKETRYI